VKRTYLSLLTLAMLFGGVGPLQAGMVFGPIQPYESFNDSPFKGLAFSYFHLETFEEGALTAPGVTASAGFVVGPGDLIDSVDGGGNGGHSFYNPNGSAGILFTFDAGVLGHLPTHAAIAWTDGDGPNRTFEAFDAHGNLIGTIIDSSPGFLVPDGDGDPSHYRLFGAIDAQGISAIFIADDDIPQVGIEVDHLQYGLQVVPEPGALTLCGVAVAGLIGYARRRR
jgi:hypothetical protein